MNRPQQFRFVHPNLKYINGRTTIQPFQNLRTACCMKKDRTLAHSIALLFQKIFHAHFSANHLTLSSFSKFLESENVVAFLIKTGRDGYCYGYDTHGLPSSVTSSTDEMQKCRSPSTQTRVVSHSICFNKEITFVLSDLLAVQVHPERVQEHID